MNELRGMFSGLHVSASGMRAQRVRQNTITSNLANAETTRTPEGGPYKRSFPVFKAQGEVAHDEYYKEGRLGGVATQENHFRIADYRESLQNLKTGMGVEVAEIRKDSRPPRMVHNPAHPDANEEGYVAMPNINIVEEMADMISASRSYEANVTAFNSTKNMLLEALKI
ncbi:flagellar basal body rod protein FlgC [Chitinivibrio alkaliphilus]|uniref:Flagellar basal-body rod protein FlgC n=1 Tax=Chitinivibrio alkaliphilus ACht1 TaxID=1313304 RepID=U7D9C3_9BACT|nr:flagellar basal body rod protein FlgC [Chitinivibrio alkaliphilus]ERP31692.1 flagellar basal-body rod protein FlgC [Chitinivibrio alkaliphilus ACht1]